MKLLRKSFLLDSSNRDVIQEIIDQYKQAGLSLNASFYESVKGVNASFLRNMQIITAKTELFSDVVRAAVEYNMAPEILVAGLNSNDSNAVLIAANSMSNTLNRQKVWMALLHLLQTNQIFSFNYATFERLYREAYQFSSQDARAICGKSNLDEQATQVCELIKSW